MATEPTPNSTDDALSQEEGPRPWIKRERLAVKGGELPGLSLTIPLFNEEGNVTEVTEDLLDAFSKAGVPLWVNLVDNGSRDGTRAEVEGLARRHERVQGVYLDKNAGYGGGILAGMNQAPPEAELLGYMWGDNQVGADDVIRVYRRLVSENADIAKARRVERSEGWQRTVITRVYNTVTLWWFHIDSPDTNGCPKLFKREAWQHLAPASTDWFLDPEIMIGVNQSDMKLAEVDVVARARGRGVSKVGAGTVAEFLVNLTRARLRG